MSRVASKLVLVQALYYNSSSYEYFEYNITLVDFIELLSTNVDSLCEVQNVCRQNRCTAHKLAWGMERNNIAYSVVAEGDTAVVLVA